MFNVLFFQPETRDHSFSQYFNFVDLRKMSNNRSKGRPQFLPFTNIKPALPKEKKKTILRGLKCF